MLRWFIFIAIYIAIDIYAFQAFRTFIRNPWFNAIYIFISTGILALFIYQLSFAGESRFMTPARMYTFGFFIALFVPKLLLTIFMLGEDIVRLFVAAATKIMNSQQSFHVPSRRKFLSTIALGAAAIPFASLLYGMYRGRYDYQVIKLALEFDDLPESFDGYTITQISDIHSGSFDNKEKIEYGVNLINEQESDAIVFTGDLVNNVFEEMLPWKSIFSTLKAKDGVYSVLGNHDYGDYVAWESEEAQAKNLENLKNLQREMGWDLLLNESRTISKNGETIKLVGVENWGVGGFKKAGDLEKACEGISNEEFKILMSHDPSHWQAQIKNHPKNIQLTLSGHTHGMQFGIEIPGFIKWSPVQYRYKNWAGIYTEFNRFINVNRGFGYLGYPGRVGIWPEITVIELKKRRPTA